MRKMRKNDKIKRIVAMVCAAFIALALIASFIVPVLAVTDAEIEEAKKKAEEAKNELTNAEKEYDNILDDFNRIDAEISSTETEIEGIESQIEETVKEIDIKNAELKAAEEEYELYKNLFLTRARVLYENSDLKYLEILFGAKSFSDFLEKLEMISQLMEYDRKILTNLHEARIAIENAKRELEGVKAIQEENLRNIEFKKIGLDIALAEKQALLDAAMNDIEKYKLIHEQAEKEEQRLIEEQKAAFEEKANPVNYDGGEFAWPVPDSRRITSPYGMRIHPVYKTQKFHSGIDIGAGYGLNIVAAAGGTVTLATTNGGYGKCIVINHGSGLTTLYGHCSSLEVSVGDKVEKGEVIGKVGSTGVSTGPHLHFETRINGATTDPMNYLGK